MGAAQRGPLDDLDARSPSLESVFLAIADGRDPEPTPLVAEGEPSMTSDQFSITRTANLARWNLVLLTRNRLAFVYAAVMLLLPLLLLFTGDRGAEAVRRERDRRRCSSSSALFPVYYKRARPVRQPPRRASCSSACAPARSGTRSS